MTNVTVVLTHHLNENDKYLQLAINGIAWQMRHNFNMHCYIVSSAVNSPSVTFNNSFTLIHKPELYNATVKFQHVYELTKANTDKYLLHSDDVIMSAKCLGNMVMAAQSVNIPFIQNPLCNGDIPAKYITPLCIQHLGKLELVPTTMDYEWAGSRLTGIHSPPPRDMLLCPFPWVAFYCTLIDKDLFERIGGLDERLDYKNNDVDFCFRAAKQNVPSMVNFGAIAFHFGSKTLNIVKKEGDDQEADRVFAEKHNIK